MNGMSVKDRMDDIAKRSGLSPEICRRVLNAESESIVESLKHGERATLAGRVTLKPELRQIVTLGGGVRNIVKVKATVSDALESELKDLTHFEVEKPNTVNAPESGIRAIQISALR